MFLDFFLHMDVHLFQHHLLKRLSLLHCTAFAPFQRSGDYIYVGLFLSSLFHSNDLFICSFNTPTLSYYSFAVNFKIREFQIFNFALFLQHCAAYFASFACPYKL